MDAGDDNDLRRGINRILFHDWDPIGVNDCAPSDEYEDCVPSVLRLLKDDANEQQISTLLQTIAKEHIGLNSKAEDNMLVAKKLRALLMDNQQGALADERTTTTITSRWEPWEGIRFYNLPTIQLPSSLPIPSAADNCLAYKINAILYDEWDPIGVKGMAPTDEYEDYVPSVLRLLKDGANEEQISGLLHKIATKTMGLDDTASEVNVLVAKKLRALMEQNEVVVDGRKGQMEGYYRCPRYSPVIHHGPYNQPPPIASAEDRLQDKINDILYYAWDPIGMKYSCCPPRDECKHYVPSILRLMKEGADVEQISQLLQKTAKAYMEIDTKPEVNMLVAKKLRAMMVRHWY